jgi:hypothetical protein
MRRQDWWHMQKVVGCIADVMGAFCMFSIPVCSCCAMVFVIILFVFVLVPIFSGLLHKPNNSQCPALAQPQ